MSLTNAAQKIVASRTEMIRHSAREVDRPSRQVRASDAYHYQRPPGGVYNGIQQLYAERTGTSGEARETTGRQ